jgi:hypothetical protein
MEEILLAKRILGKKDWESLFFQKQIVTLVCTQSTDDHFSKLRKDLYAPRSLAGIYGCVFGHRGLQTNRSTAGSAACGSRPHEQ